MKAENNESETQESKREGKRYDADTKRAARIAQPVMDLWLEYANALRGVTAMLGVQQVAPRKF